MISLSTAATLTGWSKRTLWRRLSDGTLARSSGQEILDDKKTKIDFATIASHVCIPVAADDIELIERADAGDTEAQTDLAVLFLANNKTESALYWLELAVRQNNAGSMYWLGRCHIDGTGVAIDENLGVMWIAKAASLGHLISQSLMHAMLSKGGQASRA